MNLFTSDLHAYHKNIIRFSNRPTKVRFFTIANQTLIGFVPVTKEFFKDVKKLYLQDHVDWLVELWNSQVSPEDTTYHLGDFCFLNHKKKAVVLELIERLNGKIVFIIGNHDSFRLMEYIKEQLPDKVKVSDARYVNVGGTDTYMLHYACFLWRNSHHGTYHLFGHSHGSFEHPGKALDVGLDNSYNLFGEHRFFTEDDIVEYMKTKPVYKPDHHNERSG